MTDDPNPSNSYGFPFRRNVDRLWIVTELEAAVASATVAEQNRLRPRYQFWGKVG